MFESNVSLFFHFIITHYLMSDYHTKYQEQALELWL